MTQAPTDGRLIIGVDIGGTKIAVGLVDSNGEIKCQTRTPMVTDEGAGAGLAAVISAINAISAGDAPKKEPDPRHWSMFSWPT